MCGLLGFILIAIGIWKWVPSLLQAEKNRIQLSEFFLDVKNRDERNLAIEKAYENDYTKSEIARKLGLSVAGVSKIIKKLKV
jgi:DNA-directed RNA polymerase specialized sigma subunit